MSVLNYHRLPHRVMIATDTAGYTAEGVIGEFIHKAQIVSGLNVAYAWNGSPIYEDALEHLLTPEWFDDIDDIAANGERFFGKMSDLWGGEIAALRQERGIERSGGLLVVVAGWSKQDRATKVVEFIREQGRETFEINLGWQIQPTSDPFERFERHMHRESLPSDMLALMREQRAATYPRESDGMPCHFAGGQAMLTIVTENEITQHVMERWEEDVIGKPVRPVLRSSQLDMEPSSRKLNRKQRRALASRQRA